MNASGDNAALRPRRIAEAGLRLRQRHRPALTSSIRRYIEALGGSLEITARFPDADVTITNFSEIASRDVGQPGKGKDG